MDAATVESELERFGVRHAFDQLEAVSRELKRLGVCEAFNQLQTVTRELSRYNIADQFEAVTREFDRVGLKTIADQFEAVKREVNRHGMQPVVDAIRRSNERRQIEVCNALSLGGVQSAGRESVAESSTQGDGKVASRLSAGLHWLPVAMLVVHSLIVIANQHFDAEIDQLLVETAPGWLFILWIVLAGAFTEEQEGQPK